MDTIQNEILANVSNQPEISFHIIAGETLEVAGTASIPTPFNALKIYEGAFSCAKGIAVDRYDYPAAKKQFEEEYPIKRIASWWPF